MTYSVHKNQKPSRERIPSQPAIEDSVSARIKSKQGLGISPTGVTENRSSEKGKDENNLKMVTADKKG